MPFDNATLRLLCSGFWHLDAGNFGKLCQHKKNQFQSENL